METVQVGNMARGLGLIKDASIVTTLVILLRIVPVLLEIGNARNVELMDILLRAAENGTIKTQKKDIRKGMKAEEESLLSNGREKNREDYAFVVGGDQTGVGEVSLMIGGVQLDGVLIDSGASCNLIDYETWSHLKENNIDCQSTKSEKKLFAYGKKEPIEVAGTFVSEIVCEASGEKCRDEFIVIKGPGKPLLGKSTAEKHKSDYL